MLRQEFVCNTRKKQQCHSYGIVIIVISNVLDKSKSIQMIDNILEVDMYLILWNIKYKQVSYIIVHANIFIHGGCTNTV